MKKNCLLILMTLSFQCVFSQIGINTPNPQGILHTDGQKDNPVSGPTFTPAQQSNDILVNSTGKIGVGTLVPVTKFKSNSAHD